MEEENGGSRTMLLRGRDKSKRYFKGNKLKKYFMKKITYHNLNSLKILSENVRRGIKTKLKALKNPAVLNVDKTEKEQIQGLKREITK